MYIIIGLGNPGMEYKDTRHNMGFMVLDRLAKRHSISIDKLRHKALIGKGVISGEKIVLAKPQTYMNISGQSVSLLKNWYKVDSEHIIVVYDDIDLDVGMIRIRPSGSAGTHNGMRSIIEDLGTDKFPRVRVGIGRPTAGRDLANFVLSKPDRDDLPILDEALDKAADGIEIILDKGINQAMNKCNG
ncbi:MAG: aminoacyl-tRNA hydrolase [Xylanivirga thermophila]|jgi:peptidyl-tRNA hydrolase, PTH1 family|uniref:aminoacyl-tRNA hydrolase n=1 Tax=Xylanivirga thermophila TaxID=2496273 RepID=UPI0039F5DD93